MDCRIFTTKLDIKQSTVIMLSKVEEQVGFKAPPASPCVFTLTLIMINFFVSLQSPTPMLYILMIFLYSYKLVTPYLDRLELYLGYLIFLNIVLIWAYLQEIPIGRLEENIVFTVVGIIEIGECFHILKGIFKAYFFITPMKFQWIFWIVQLATFSEFVKYFTEIKILRFSTSVLRTCQQLRVGTKKSCISAVRYTCHFIKQLQPPWSMSWIVFCMLTSLWDLQSNYNNELGIHRVLSGKGQCFYSRTKIGIAFVGVVFCQMGWMWAGVWALSFNALRKIVWNFLRIQNRLAEECDKKGIDIGKF